MHAYLFAVRCPILHELVQSFLVLLQETVTRSRLRSLTLPSRFWPIALARRGRRRSLPVMPTPAGSAERAATDKVLKPPTARVVSRQWLREDRLRALLSVAAAVSAIRGGGAGRTAGVGVGIRRACLVTLFALAFTGVG